jgi:selenide,water dikinase
LLGQVLRRVAPAAVSPDLLAGFQHYDDAGAVRLAPGRVGLYTVDFFPPVVDDPRAYGAIAAANSISDIYACGGEAKVVLNLAGFPEEWGEDILGPLFEGAVEKVMEAGALWVGGHSVRSKEPLFGFAVFGEVSESQRVGHEHARPGDILILTKPLGAGSITTGVKKDKTKPEDAAAAVAIMSRLNRPAARAMRESGVRAATDITGFGLLGHASNLAQASGVRLQLRAGSLPLYAGAADLAQRGILSGGSARGRAALDGKVAIGAKVPEWLANIAFDAETSGGILACVPATALGRFRQAYVAAGGQSAEAVEVGEILGGPPGVVLI